MQEPLYIALEKLTRSVTKAAAGPGPIKWCKRCSRKHGSHEACSMVSVAVEAKSGRFVRRYVHQGGVDA